MLLCRFAAMAGVDSTAMSEPNIYIGASTGLPADSVNITVRRPYAFSEGKYKGRDFDYSASVKPKQNFLLRWLDELLRRLFDNNAKATRNTIHTIAVLLIIMAVFVIVMAIINKEGGWIFRRKKDDLIAREGDIEKQILTTDFNTLIANTLLSGNQRLAIRYYYLWLLKELSNKGDIALHPEKTNADYQYEISNPDLKTRFAYLSYLYNYIWYGAFELNEDTFARAKSSFDETLKRIS